MYTFFSLKSSQSMDVTMFLKEWKDDFGSSTRFEVYRVRFGLDLLNIIWVSTAFDSWITYNIVATKTLINNFQTNFALIVLHSSNAHSFNARVQMYSKHWTNWLKFILINNVISHYFVVFQVIRMWSVQSKYAWKLQPQYQTKSNILIEFGSPQILNCL